MEFLRSKFHDELNEEGIIKISGAKFYRDEILKTMEEETYHQAFLDWKEKKINDCIEKADEILKNFNTERRFKALKQRFENKKILPFIGAGMSMPSGYSGWTSFLYQLMEESSITEAQLNELIDDGKYEEAAQLLYDNMPTNSFNDELENEYHLDNDIEGAVQYLPSLFKSSIITTNFDNLLKRCYDEAGCSFNETLYGADSEELSRLISQEENLLIKLHGKANTERKRILTKNEYDQFYSNEEVLKNAIEILCSNSLLFLGCSLTVDRTIKTMIEIAEKKGLENIPKHYTIIGLKYEEDMSEEEFQEIKLKKRDELAKANIHPIWYKFISQYEHDECIEALLVKLADGIVEL